jgi:uncharacterized protein YndB with AHSA1/START domain
MVAMASSATATVTLPSDTQILIRREFDALRELVYRAWTTPELIERWWSGDRGTVTRAEVDLRVGGSWRYVMVANEGFEVAFHGEFREIVPNERIVSTEVYDAPGSEGDAYPPGDEQAALNTITFAEEEGRTLLTLLVDCPTKEIRDAIVGSGMEVGMQEAWTKLEQVARSLA